MFSFSVKYTDCELAESIDFVYMLNVRPSDCNYSIL